MDFQNDPVFIQAVAVETAKRLASDSTFCGKVAVIVADKIAIDPAYRAMAATRAGDTLARSLQHALEKDIKEAAKKEVANIIGLQLGAKVAKLANQLAAKLTLPED